MGRLEVLVETAAKRHIEDLHSPADRKQGHAVRESEAAYSEIEIVLLAVETVNVGVWDLLAVRGR